MRRIYRKYIIFLPIALFPLIGWADYTDRLCRILNYACSKGSSGASHTSNSYPASSDAIGSNPAAIPTDKTPFGVEVLSGNGDTDFSLFQGYGKFGLAAGSITKEKAFFSNASNLAAANITLPQGTGEDLNKKNYNFGFAFPIMKDKLKNLIVPYIGLGIRRYKESEHFRESYGLSLAHRVFHFGAGLAKNDENTGVLSLSGGFKWSRFSFDFTRISNMRGLANETDIYSFIYLLNKVTLLTAFRRQKIQDLSLADKLRISNEKKKYQESHLFLGAQLQLGKMLSIGHYINYVLQEGGFIGIRVTLGAF